MPASWRSPLAPQLAEPASLARQTSTLYTRAAADRGPEAARRCGWRCGIPCEGPICRRTRRRLAERDEPLGRDYVVPSPALSVQNCRASCVASDQRNEASHRSIAILHLRAESDCANNSTRQFRPPRRSSAAPPASKLLAAVTSEISNRCLALGPSASACF